MWSCQTLSVLRVRVRSTSTVSWTPTTWTWNWPSAGLHPGRRRRASAHVWFPVDMDAALDLARRHGLEVIEDCVHALGATWDGRPVGSFGRVSFYSTEETKIISSTMGGMATTDDPDLAKKLRAFQAQCASQSFSETFRYVLKLPVYHLLTEPHLHPYARALYEWSGRFQPLSRATSNEEMEGIRPVKYERCLSNSQAALALRQLARLDDNLAHRRACAQHYRERLAAGGITAAPLSAKANPAYVRYPVWVQNKAAAVRTTARHVVLGTWFDSVIEESVSPAHGGYEAGSCPRAEESDQTSDQPPDAPPDHDPGRGGDR